MTRRDAKRLAARSAGELLDAALLSGEAWIGEDADGRELSEEDAERMEIAVEELRDELLRRGGLRGGGPS